MPIQGKEELIERLRRNSDQLCRALLLETQSRLMQKTPVDTGRARANWNLSIGEIDPAVDEEATSADVPGKQAEGVAVVAEFRAGQVGYVTNALPYIPELEKGHSKQAPAGMVAVTVAELQPLIGRIAAKIASGGE